MSMLKPANSSAAADWTLMTNRPKRSLSSIILDPGVKEMLVRDARDFLSSWRWYVERGIPFRRGYLLVCLDHMHALSAALNDAYQYGAPGSGKTSMIQSIAGELGLNVYIVTLSRLGMDDAELNTLISIMPRRCIALIEDIDAALPNGMKRNLPSGQPVKQADEGDGGDGDEQSKKGAAAPGVTLSGLLNALDGIGAHEGRILFATTNDYKALDPALCRPGRMDVHVEFKLASKYQAQNLYKSFFVPDDSDPEGDRGMQRPDNIDEKMPLLQSSLEHPSRPSAHGVPLHEVLTLAARFADAIPERELSMASLQGYLMMYKTRPREAVDEVQQWVDQEMRAKEGRK